MHDNELFTEDETSVSPDEVAAFLAEEENSQKGEVPSDIKDMLSAPVEDVTEKDSRVSIAPDKSFDDDKRNLFEDMMVSVRDVDIPITDEDKSIYLKCLLFSSPVELNIKAPNGIHGKCRSLSVYESDVAAYAFSQYIKKYPDTAPGFQEGILQQLRIAMQLQEYCGHTLPYLSYERGVNGSIEQHAEDLYEKSQRILDVPGPVYGIYVRLLNIFHYKLGRLHESAFNSDFWSPVGTD